MVEISPKFLYEIESGKRDFLQKYYVKLQGNLL